MSPRRSPSPPDLPIRPSTDSPAAADAELKARHRAMWASGDYVMFAPHHEQAASELVRGTPDRARFELEYLLAVGTRA